MTVTSGISDHESDNSNGYSQAALLNSPAASATAGTLYVVSTPIGNLDDFSPRAVATLKQVAAIAAEDTRHSGKLLSYWGIDTPMFAYHDHSDPAVAEKLLSRLDSGESIALVSDAGTPLIADPGYRLVNAARARGLQVVPIPGACALIAALSVSGLPTDRFTFEGFLPAKREQRRKALVALKHEPRTMVFYEAPHRLFDTLQAMLGEWGSQRRVMLARELSKRFETLIEDELAVLVERVGGDPDQQRGECVLVVQGYDSDADSDAIMIEAERVLKLLLEELSVSQSAALASRISGLPKKQLYKLALSISDQANSTGEQ